MCKFCWEVADDQDKEDTKQALNGEYCQHFGCWEYPVTPYGHCSAHGDRSNSADRLPAIADRLPAIADRAPVIGAYPGTADQASDGARGADREWLPSAGARSRSPAPRVPRTPDLQCLFDRHILEADPQELVRIIHTAADRLAGMRFRAAADL